MFAWTSRSSCSAVAEVAAYMGEMMVPCMVGTALLVHAMRRNQFLHNGQLLTAVSELLQHDVLFYLRAAALFQNCASNIVCQSSDRSSPPIF